MKPEQIQPRPNQVDSQQDKSTLDQPARIGKLTKRDQAEIYIAHGILPGDEKKRFEKPKYEAEGRVPVWAELLLLNQIPALSEAEMAEAIQTIKEHDKTVLKTIDQQREYVENIVDHIRSSQEPKERVAK